jgi:hypothetical protein
MVDLGNMAMLQYIEKALELKRQLTDAMPGSREMIREIDRRDDLISDLLPPH